MDADGFPGRTEPVDRASRFSFSCERRLDCFTSCCRELELALTPYDLLRLRRATGLSSAELHERCIIEEFGAADVLPRYYLTMVDDGRASCVFVRADGCAVYQDRPGACRTYPVGRATVRQAGTLEERFVLLHEPHCRGFAIRREQTVAEFLDEQGVEPYNRFNDLFAGILQHERIRQGMKPTPAQRALFRLALYDLDTFREKLAAREQVTGLAVPANALTDDDALLEFGLDCVRRSLFGE